MRTQLILSAVVFLALSAHVALNAQAPAGKTVWDGVYTDAQAERAQGVFGASCARCHTLTSDGRRPLSGAPFVTKNTQKTVGELLTFVSANMPNGAGGTLSAGEYNDLVALILKSNGFPAGTTEVAPEAVAKVMIGPKGGGGELPADALVRVVGCLAAKSGADWTITNATAPERTEKTVPGPDDATKALGDRTVTLKFVLSRLDTHVGKRVSVTGLTIGAGGVNGLNVSSVTRVAETCP
jgi:mono/diheme cytochrome c family protein